MKIREEVLKDSDNKNRLYNIYTCDYCFIEYRKQKRTAENSTQEHYCCNECYKNRADNPAYIVIECAHCKLQFKRLKSKLIKSKSGLYFCCREHKDVGQTYIKEIQPSHYGTTKCNYRELALKTYKHECAKCGFPVFEALEVHHIDRNSSNNSVDNLVVLCANCHTILHKIKEIYETH